jgi:hypothetical protein
MPAVGEVEQHPGDSFWRSGSEEKGHRETSTLGKKKNLQVLLFWSIGQEATVQLCPGEGQGRRKDPEARVGAAWNRGAAHSREEEENGRRSADEGAREKKGGRNRAGGLGKKRNGCSTNDER